MMMKSSQQILITFIPSTLILVVIISVNLLFTSNIYSITSDGSFLSNLGVILWSVAATVCFFAAVLICGNKQQEATKFLVYSALLTAYLLFDDFFQLHERHIPNYLNIDEKFVYAILGIAASILVIRFKLIILQTNYIVMLVALGFLAISVASDSLLNPMEIVYGILAMIVALLLYISVSHRSIFKEYSLVVLMMIISISAAFFVLKTDAEYSESIFEEGAKWLGISGWCSYYTHTAYQFVVNFYANGTTKQPVI